jgi:hypothetical protein
MNGPFRACAACLLLAAVLSPAAAQVAPEDRELAVAAARHDAYLNLAQRVLAYPVRGGRQVGHLLAADAKLRRRVEADLRAAPVVGTPHIDSHAVAHVTLEFEIDVLPYDLRLKLLDPPRALRIEGLAKVDAAVQIPKVNVGQVTAEIEAWAEKNLQAEGRADIPARGDPAEARAKARQEAITAAQAALAEKALALELEPGVTVEAYLRQHPALYDPFQATLSIARLASERIDRRGTAIEVEIALPGKLLMWPLKLGGYRTLFAEPLSPAQVELARKNARRGLEALVRRRIDELSLAGGKKAAELIEQRPEMEAEVRRLCHRMPLERVEITPHGLVKMYGSFPTRSLPRELRRRLSVNSPAVLYGVGGGVPKEPAEAGKKPEPAPEKGPENKTIAGKGTARFDAYVKQGIARATAIVMAKRVATVLAQRDLIAQYARTFLDNDAKVKAFVARKEAAIADAGGRLKGVRVAGEKLTADQGAVEVSVEATLNDLRTALGR